MGKRVGERYRGKVVGPVIEGDGFRVDTGEEQLVLVGLAKPQFLKHAIGGEFEFEGVVEPGFTDTEPRRLRVRTVRAG